MESAQQHHQPSSFVHISPLLEQATYPLIASHSESIDLISYSLEDMHLVLAWAVARSLSFGFFVRSRLRLRLKQTHGVTVLCLWWVVVVGQVASQLAIPVCRHGWSCQLPRPAGQQASFSGWRFRSTRPTGQTDQAREGNIPGNRRVYHGNWSGVGE